MALRGAVQGVGFRPFIHRLATNLGLAGWVNNSCAGVSLEVEGPRPRVEQFLLRLEAEKPPHSFIQSLESWWLDAVGYAGFEIRPNEPDGPRTAVIMPDLATCPECLREIIDPQNRRHLYPFANCTQCGPRFSIVESLPYDRANTSMKRFAMCPQCQQEYDDPANRRFHAQPNACAKCGPHLELWDTAGATLALHHDALLQAVKIVREGKILALKGIGGFQLLVDARDEVAVRRLRQRKQREEKPFAVMYPSLKAVAADCHMSAMEARLLTSSESPIVLLNRIAALAPSVAPGNPNLGVMLPYSPLHHLLMLELGFPVVATSGNLSDEPICIDEREALQRLGNIADLFLVHNRPIVRHMDDSVARVLLGREQILRRARGYAPLPLPLPAGRLASDAPVLAVGGHLKNTVALAIGPQVFLSQHIGDLETAQSCEAFVRVINDFERLYESQPGLIAHDGHPEYLSTKYVTELLGKHPASRSLGVQHHLAHVLACMADNEVEPPALGVAWDGTGDGLDGTIWGGEFLLVTENSVQRRAHLRPFRLAGGDKAIKEPGRIALGLLHEISAAGPSGLFFSESKSAALRSMLDKGLNSPPASSVGRLFDGVAALIGLGNKVSFEGQAAMAMEFSLEGFETEDSYSFKFTGAGDVLVLDWQPVVEGVLVDLKFGRPAGEISAKFHNALVEAIIDTARRIGQRRVALTGGCFQNRYLTERAVRRLGQEGFNPLWHQRVPPNDGGIALGQIQAARRPRDWT